MGYPSKLITLIPNEYEIKILLIYENIHAELQSWAVKWLF